MNTFYFFCVCFFSLLSILYASAPKKSDCLEKEKALTLLETVEDFLSKAEDSFPSCEEESNSTDQSECDGQKPLAYIEISKKIISDIRKNFPTCPKVIVQHKKPNDCSEILASEGNESGFYVIWPSESNTTGKPLLVHCDMETENGGWTVIQRRGKFPVQQDFYQDWESYKNGFGNISEEFWFGNENIRVLCHKGCEIRFDIQDKDGEKGFAVYRNFTLSGNNYTIRIGDYEGNVGDGMVIHNNSDFSTKDIGKTSTSELRNAGWWFSGTTNCNLNGRYQPGEKNVNSVYWYTWRSFENLSSVEIKVRPFK